MSNKQALLSDQLYDSSSSDDDLDFKQGSYTPHNILSSNPYSNNSTSTAAAVTSSSSSGYVSKDQRPLLGLSSESVQQPSESIYQRVSNLIPLLCVLNAFASLFKTILGRFSSPQQSQEESDGYLNV